MEVLRRELVGQPRRLLLVAGEDQRAVVLQRLPRQIPPRQSPQLRLQLAVYRLVQAGLTNALRHAAGAQHVDVRIERIDDLVRVTVEDDGPNRPTRMTGAGRGLAGLRERVALYGGTLDAGPGSNGGWRLAATLHGASGSREGGA